MIKSIKTVFIFVAIGLLFIVFVWNIQKKPSTQSITNSSLNFVDSPKIGKEINDSWEHMHDGNIMMRNGDYSSAIEAYSRAYALQNYVGPLPGFRLIEAYEKNGQPKDALRILDELDTRYHLRNNKSGLKRYEEIYSRNSETVIPNG